MASPNTWSPNYDCVEEFNTRQENWNSETPSVRVTLRCAMADRYLALADIVGKYRAFPSEEKLPVQLKAVDGSIRLDNACKMPDVTGEVFKTGYDALLDITYTYVPGEFYEQVDQPINEDWPEALYAEDTYESSMEFITQEYTKFQWADHDTLLPPDDEDTLTLVPGTGQKPDEGVGQEFYVLELNRMVKGYKRLPVGYDANNMPIDFLSCAGTVHNKEYVPIHLADIPTFPAGTLLLTQPKISYGAHLLRYDAAGNAYGPSWKVSAKLIYRKYGHFAYWQTTCDGNVDKSGWYNLLYKKCVDQDEKLTVYRPHRFLDLTEFLFYFAEFPPVPDWPPS